MSNLIDGIIYVKSRYPDLLKGVQLLDFFKAMSDPTRLRLIAVLQQSECTVQELVEILQVGQSRVSRHLKIMLQAGILDVHRQGTWAYYRLAQNSVLDAIDSHLLPALNALPEFTQDQQRHRKALAQRGEQSRDFFEQHGTLWREQAKRAMPDLSYREHLLECLPPSKIAVEVGVGNGELLQSLSQRLPSLIAVDRSATMLEAAQESLTRRKRPAVDMRLGDMAHLPLKDQEVDLVILDMVLHHAASPVIVLSEISRVLKPGGTLILADLSAHEQEWMRSELADQWLGFQWHDLQHWLQQSDLHEVHYRQVPSGSDAPDPFLLVAVRPAH